MAIEPVVVETRLIGRRVPAVLGDISMTSFFVSTNKDTYLPSCKYRASRRRDFPHKTYSRPPRLHPTASTCCRVTCTPVGRHCPFYRCLLWLGPINNQHRTSLGLVLACTDQAFYTSNYVWVVLWLREGLPVDYRISSLQNLSKKKTDQKTYELLTVFTWEVSTTHSYLCKYHSRNLKISYSEICNYASTSWGHCSRQIA